MYLSENQTHWVSAGGQQGSLAALGSRVRLASGQQVNIVFQFTSRSQIRPRSYVSYFTEKGWVKPCTQKHHKGIA